VPKKKKATPKSDFFIECLEKNPIFLSGNQFEIVSFRKGEDGKDLVFTRERESSTLLSYPCSTQIAGMIKNAEGKVNGKITYARITIRRIKNQ